MNSKSGKAYTAPLLGWARDVLERLHFTIDTRLVFADPVKKQPMHSRITFQASGEPSGVPGSATATGVINSSASCAVDKGVPLNVVSQWLYHASITRQLAPEPHITPAIGPRRANVG